ncbi:Transcriptional regulatory protein ZraR [Planctomycetes bacterium Poly30]|uniref:Transcriptional regulatory protein ZraR n=1 Tax=Saltatorellus ferox TaxID=2528018 RepID=A0A518ENT5_9BACT|nr:Transcriptional regulatory protein ZraR [Planctomycetes bacterium Poly30]
MSRLPSERASDSLTGKSSGSFDLDFHRDPAILAALGTDLGLGVFSVDTAGRFVGWSDGAEAITGYARGEVLGQPCRLLEGPNCKGFSGLAEILAAASPEVHGMENQECRILTKRASERHLLGNVKVLRDSAGETYGAIGVFSDITDVLRVNAPEADRSGAAGRAGLVGTSRAMEEIFRRIQLAADSDVTTLITGESGTGKELAARAIHGLSDRKDRPFVAINCSAIPEGLLESELFGHAKGAFTGAIRDRAGVFQSADGGTLFLDEIGEVSPHIQVKLLRVLQERVVQRVGDDRPIPVDVRLLTATNRDLHESVAEGSIRDDFYYRIRVFDIRMPALRERASDIPLLARHFVEEVSRARGKSVDGIAHDALEAMVRYSWPGNVRELHNAIEYAMVVQRGDTLGLLDLPEDVRGRSQGGAASLGQAPRTPDEEAERMRILRALDDHGWNRSRASESLGISRVTLWKKIRRYGIDEGVFKRGTRG